MQLVSGIPVYGVDIGPSTRCAHYHTDRDVLAFKFDCCERYYPCIRCHEAVTDHDAEPWPRHRFSEPSVLCGACGTTFTAPEYLECEYRCPSCEVSFNPGCEAHLGHYLER
ncbi:hypothetical protein CV102_23620 [Natronococcus pandeyae]|uniref:CHY-type domain-containing protein n=1 Tax=Natronococcus pandeyae TaxID=2055836 RepID=A0A8J8PZ17_9EURY|nr:CHY zinc finger protein [Natronococcus pandeyae]TYL36272.1 hypothetical protein CV102_23620 [Natronococcus pandeyae]